MSALLGRVLFIVSKMPTVDGQEAVEPEAVDSDIRIEYNCGFCKKWFCYKSKIHPELDFRTKYCPHCGRKVKWNEADKCGCSD